MRKSAVRLLSWLLAGLAAGSVLSPAARATTAGATAPAVNTAAPALIEIAGRPRDLLAIAGEDHFWIARVAKDLSDNSIVTSIVFRSRWSGNAEWSALPAISDRVVSLATANGDLMLVLANGQWEIADDTDVRSGPTGSQWDEMLAIASGSDVTWAVVRWLPVSTQDTTTTSPTTNATTEAEIEPRSLEPETRPAELAPRLMVTSYAEGKWTGVEPLPDGVGDDPAQMSLEVLDGMPVLAWRTAEGRLCVSRLTEDRGWTPPVFVAAPAGPFDFKLLRINGKGALWIAQAPPATSRPTVQPSAGDVLTGDDFSRRIGLGLATNAPSNIGPQTLVSAFGNLRWITYAGDRQIEQDYSEDAFPNALPPARMFVAPITRPATIPLSPWIGGYGVLVLLAGLAAIRKRTVAEPENAGDARAARGGEESKPQLAPLGLRFVAGLVDLAPIFAAVAMLHPADAANPLAGFDPGSLEGLCWLAVGAYVLHTMIAELICGQSIGKMVFGLRVVNGEVQRPSAVAIVLRNLLRIMDIATLGLPLLVVLITPLRQRVGDMAAGTVVIARNGEDDEDRDRAA